MQKQLKSAPGKTRRSSRNATNADLSPETMDKKLTVMSGQSLSPAKKLSRLMREKPLKSVPKTPSPGVLKNREKKNNNEKDRSGHNLNANSSSVSKSSKSVKIPAKPSNSKRDTGGKIQAASVSCMKNGKRSSGSNREASGKGSVNVKPRKDKNLSGTSAKKELKCGLTGVEGKHHMKNKNVHKHASIDKGGERQPEHGSSPSKPVKKHHTKKPRPKAERDTSKAAPTGDIAALLRLGEGATDDAPMSDDSDWEAVDTHASDLVTKGFVEVTLPSDVAMQKKKKKGFDVEAYMKRQLSKARRELQQLLHKTHLLCLLSRALQLNTLLNSETPLACAMSMLPSKYAYPPKRVSLSYVEKFLKWFREKVPLEARAEGVSPSEDVFRTLEARLRTKKASSALELVCLFVLILRAIGVDCRLVMSLQPVPLKPAPPPSASASGKTAAAKSTKSAAKPKQTSKQDQKGAKASASGKKAALSANTPKGKRASATPSRAGSNRKAKQRASTSAAQVDSSDDSSGDEFEPRRPDRRVLSSSSSSEGSPGATGTGGRSGRAAADFWAEVYVEEELRWISVDVVGGGVHCVAQIRRRATAPLVYVLGCDNTGHVKDLTARYDPKWHSTTRKLRVESDWWEEATGAWRAAPTRREKEEDEELLRDLQERPMPQSIAEFKDHPLYALERHLLKFEAIYPRTAVPLGFIGKGERSTPVYARECVRTLHAKETWIKQARVVKEGEKPYKIVKARPKWDKLLQKAITDKPLEVFGRWQTTEYVPPRASGGKVPRNDYGNVELFKPSMLPGGTVHLQGDGLSRVAKRLGIDCAPAMVGWDYHCGGSHPVFEGYVVCEEFEDTLMDAWEADQRESRRRQREKREKRVLDNWRRLVRGLQIKQRLARKYDFKDDLTGTKRSATSDRPNASKKARTPADKAEHKTQPKTEPMLPPNLEPTVTAAVGQAGRAANVDGKSEPKPASKLSAKLRAAQAAKQTPKLEPKEEPKEDEEVPETQEEVARRVEASMASMGLRRVTLSSDSEADSDTEGTAPKAKPGGTFGAAVMAKLSPAVSSGSVKRPSPAAPAVAAQRKRRSAPAAKRRARKAPSASPSPSPDPAGAGAGAAGRATRRRSGRVTAVDYREAAGSGSDGEPPLREDDLTSDEEQPFVRAAERPAASSDDDGDFMGF